MATKNFEERLNSLKGTFHKVVPFKDDDHFLKLDFSEHNKDLTDTIIDDTELFIQYIKASLIRANARYGIGGYNENRTIYRTSKLFNMENREEPRTVHLGVDIWGKPYTHIMAPLDGIVHSFAFNNAKGDYGATIILTHRLDDISFHTLYGHLSLNSIKNLSEGETIKRGDVFTEFGIPFENGQWPPHLHFQLILDMEGKEGDYPGVCKYSERDKYLNNCPDPNLILNFQ
jgi:murein DD-endopeptidase MepM/ murein hydrolase activator NlpD